MFVFFLAARVNRVNFNRMSFALLWDLSFQHTAAQTSLFLRARVHLSTLLQYCAHTNRAKTNLDGELTCWSFLFLISSCLLPVAKLSFSKLKMSLKWKAAGFIAAWLCTITAKGCYKWKRLLRQFDRVLSLLWWETNQSEVKTQRRQVLSSQCFPTTLLHHKIHDVKKRVQKEKKIPGNSLAGTVFGAQDKQAQTRVCACMCAWCMCVLVPAPI